MKKRSKKTSAVLNPRFVDPRCIVERLPWTSPPSDSDYDEDEDEPLPYFSFRSSELTKTLSISQIIEMTQKNIDEIIFNGKKPNIEKGECSLEELLLIKRAILQTVPNPKLKFNFKKLFCFSFDYETHF